MAVNAKQGILSLKVGDKKILYNAYMSYLKGGGLFIPTPQRYSLGDEVVLLITLQETNDRMSVAGKVVWVTPKDAGSHIPGVGVQFGANGDEARNKIEALLGGMLDSDKPTQTM